MLLSYYASLCPNHPDYQLVPTPRKGICQGQASTCIVDLMDAPTSSEGGPIAMSVPESPASSRIPDLLSKTYCL